MEALLLLYAVGFLLQENRLQRFINIIFTLDCAMFSVVTAGQSYPYESFSSAAYRAELTGRFYRHARPLIDTLLWFDKNHCKRAYTQAILNLPEDMRGPPA